MTAAAGVLELYLGDVAHRGFRDDPAQRHVAEHLDRVLADLRRRRPQGLLSRLRRPEPVRGLYIHGGVGRGKTYLMDRFFDLAPGEAKLRQHFHRFMQRVHDELAELKGRSDPLDTVAQKIAAATPLICFDEFFVSDIADAMILGRLFGNLFDAGVTLVATSNVHPDELYRDGLQRSRFLPAIERLKQHTTVVEAAGDTDYRLRVLEQAQIYHYPLDEQAGENLCRYFDGIAPCAPVLDGQIEIAHRAIDFVRRADGIIWFDFDALCAGPRGVEDYIEIARCFATVIVSDIPVLGVESENEARRFIALVDEFYDRRVKLFISASAALEALYTGNRLRFEFRRTMSRLREMQGHDYLALAHRP